MARHLTAFNFHGKIYAFVTNLNTAQGNLSPRVLGFQMSKSWSMKKHGAWSPGESGPTYSCFSSFLTFQLSWWLKSAADALKAVGGMEGEQSQSK